MICIETKDGTTIMVLEPGNLEHLTKGGLVGSPNGRVALYYSPDTPWLGERIQKAIEAENGLSHADLERLVLESLSREPALTRGYHEPKLVIADGKTLESDYDA